MEQTPDWIGKFIVVVTGGWIAHTQYTWRDYTIWSYQPMQALDYIAETSQCHSKVWNMFTHWRGYLPTAPVWMWPVGAGEGAWCPGWWWWCLKWVCRSGRGWYWVGNGQEQSWSLLWEWPPANRGGRSLPTWKLQGTSVEVHPNS